VKRFVFDPNRCTGCGACVVGCWSEHAHHQTRPWRRVHGFNPLRHPDLPAFSLSLACNHCEAPACLEQCPALAYRVDAGTGAVLHDVDACIGCQFCIWVCPYDAPKFDAAAGVVEKCTFCVERLHDGLAPACVAACPVEALGVEEREAPPGTGHPPATAGGPGARAIAGATAAGVGAAPPAGPTPAPAARVAGGAAALAGFPASDLRPAIRIVPLRGGAPRAPGLGRDPAALAGWMEAALPEPPARVSARHEWALVALTWTFGVLAGIMGASALGAVRPDPLAFLAAGAVAMALSTSHLGRPERAWRALLNLRRSWLSREVAALSGFLLLAGLHFLRPDAAALGWAAAAAGLAATLTMDRVYQVAARRPRLWLHSGQTSWSALYLLAILAGGAVVATGAAAARLLLYAAGRGGAGPAGRPAARMAAAAGAAPRATAASPLATSASAAAAAARVAVGLVAPVAVLLAGGGAVVAATLAAAGDLVDRAQFYDALDLPSPQAEAVRATRRRLREASAAAGGTSAAS
jgi:Fe-S-cluster-containing dehydrogenase component/DMSO reductase anchor subunit